MNKEFYSLGSELWCQRIITSGELSLMKPTILNFPFTQVVLKCIKISRKGFGGLAWSEKSLGMSPSVMFVKGLKPVAKMASHAIFQYNVLAIDDTHNTWTNVIVKMTILRLLGSSDDKEKRGVARPEGPPLRGLRYGGPWKLFGPRDKDWGILLSPVKPTVGKMNSPVQSQRRSAG